MLLIQVLLKHYLIAELWHNSARSNVNNFAGVIDIIANILNPDELRNLFRTIIGQIFYMGVSSLLTIFVGFIFLIRSIWRCKQSYYGLLFTLLSVVFSFGVSVLYMSKNLRPDHIIYGRYNESVVGPLILMGLYYVLHREKIKRNNSMVYTIASFVILGVFLSLMNIPDMFYDKVFCSITIVGMLPYIGMTGNADFLLAAAVVSIFALTMYIIVKKRIRIYEVLVSTLIAVFFIITDFISLECYLKPNSDDYLSAKELVDVISQDVRSAPVIVYGDTNCYEGAYQYLLMDKEIEFLQSDPYTSIHSLRDSYVITKIEYFNEYCTGSKLLKTTSAGDMLWVTPGELQTPYHTLD